METCQKREGERGGERGRGEGGGEGRGRLSGISWRTEELPVCEESCLVKYDARPEVRLRMDGITLNRLLPRWLLFPFIWLCLPVTVEAVTSVTHVRLGILLRDTSAIDM